MMVHPCDKPCGNKTASGFCATTVCINSQYSNIGTAQYGQGVQKRIVTNADKIRAMTDEELTEWFIRIQYDVSDYYCGGHSCEPTLPTGEESWIGWLKQEASDDNHDD